jgi:hypothetical protein
MDMGRFYPHIATASHILLHAGRTEDAVLVARAATGGNKLV